MYRKDCFNVINIDYSKVSFSRIESIIPIQPIHSNSMGNAHGGELMKIMDNTGGLSAYKHAKGKVVTARVDDLVFHRPVHIGNVLNCIGQVIYVGNSSILSYVALYIYNVKDGTNTLALSGYTTMIHIADEKPSKVPGLVPTTEEEKELYKVGEKKYYEIKERTKNM